MARIKIKEGGKANHCCWAAVVLWYASVVGGRGKKVKGRLTVENIGVVVVKDFTQVSLPESLFVEDEIER